MGYPGSAGPAVSLHSTQQLRSGFRSGYPFYPYNRFNRGCWNCGFGGFGFGGWGFGLGWGWPGLGFWGWNPFWVDPFWGWPAGGYGYYASPNYGVYSYPDSGSYAPYDNAAPPEQPDNSYDSYDESNSNNNWVTPNSVSPSYAPNSGAVSVPVLIFMKNGSVYTVSDYWMTNDEFYYVLSDGSQHSVSMDQVDLTRTNSENAKSGVKFIFKSDPTIVAPAPDGSATPPTQRDAAPGKLNAPVPAPPANGTTEPEART